MVKHICILLIHSYIIWQNITQNPLVFLKRKDKASEEYYTRQIQMTPLLPPRNPQGCCRGISWNNFIWSYTFWAQNIYFSTYAHIGKCLILHYQLWVPLIQGFYLLYPFTHLLFTETWLFTILQTQSTISHLTAFIHFGPHSMKSLLLFLFLICVWQFFKTKLKFHFFQKPF